MKKLLIISLGFFAFACGNADNTTANDAENETTIQDESVEIGSGEEVSPQLEYDADSARMEVDTLTSATDANQRKQ